MTGEPTHTAAKERNGTAHPSNQLSKVKYPIRFVVSYVKPVTQHYKSRTVRKNQSSHNEKYGGFLYEGKPPRPTTKLTLCTVCKDEWDTKLEGNW